MDQISAYTNGWQPRIVGIGGTTREGSSSERALLAALDLAERRGASTASVLARDLDRLPMYAPERDVGDPESARMLELVARADGVLIATPGFHGGPSGLLKNALDYLDELRSHEAPYLEGRAVGCIVCAAGWQATTTTLATLRSTVHALRGWPTPLGVTINSTPLNGTSVTPHDQDAAFDPIAAATPQLEVLVDQVMTFAYQRHAAQLVNLAGALS